MAGLLDYGSLARFLMNPVQQVNDPYSAMKKGILDLPATEGARVYQGGANTRGFDRTKVWYHGTQEDIGKLEGTLFVTDNPSLASEYATGMAGAPRYPSAKVGPNVLPVYIRPSAKLKFFTHKDGSISVGIPSEDVKSIFEH